MNTQVFEKEQLNLVLASTSPVEIPSPIQIVAPLPAAARRPSVHAEVGQYRLRLAESVADRDAACRLRFKVFNIELGKGLESSYETGMDSDQFDLFCEHLLVEEKASGRIVGTYRMQSGTAAAQNLGYYSEQEFNLAPYEPLRAGILELGRASIDRDHRTPEVLTLLWRGIAQYATEMGLRYLIGCSSLNSKDPAEGWQMYRQLEQYRVSPEFETAPTVSYACPRSRKARAHSRRPSKKCELANSFFGQDSQAAEDLPGHWRAHCGAAGVGPRVRHHRFPDIARSEADFAGSAHRFLAPLTQ